METYVTAKFTELLQAINNRLPANAKPSRIIPVVPGTQVAWDDCCAGQLTARLAALTPINSADSTVMKCGISHWKATGEIVLLRCALKIDNNGNAPAALALNVEGQSALSDSDVLLATITEQSWVTGIAAWAPLGPRGGCRGIQVTFNFTLDNPTV